MHLKTGTWIAERPGHRAQRLSATLMNALRARGECPSRTGRAQRLSATLMNAPQRPYTDFASVPTGAQRLSATLMNARQILRELHVLRVQCSTPFGDIDECTRPRLLGLELLCSTPFGDIDECTCNFAGAGYRFLPRAQRLSATLMNAPRRRRSSVMLCSARAQRLSATLMNAPSIAGRTWYAGTRCAQRLSATLMNAPGICCLR